MTQAYHLIIEPPSGGRFEHRLPKGSYILGSGEDCDLTISSLEVSQQRLKLVLAEPLCSVKDLGSNSGTSHEGQAVTGDQSLAPPFVLNLGAVRLSVDVVAEDGMATIGGETVVGETVGGETVGGETVGMEGDPVGAGVDGVGVTGHYTKGREIARGGMDAILEANDQLLGRTVAMKIIRLDLGASESVRLRFIREATVLARLEHPNIVPIHEMGKDSSGALFYTMKKVEGRTLQAILNDLKNGDPATLKDYSLDALLTIFRKICDAIAFAHSKGIIHRDLKPENIMVGAFGEALVMDWGLAKILQDAEQTVQEIEMMAQAAGGSLETQMPEGFEELSDTQLGGSSQNLTLDGSVMGSPQYMPPEQAEGRVAELDERSDVFSLGGILYAILTLRPPVEGSSVQEVLDNVTSGNITPPTRFNPGSAVEDNAPMETGSVSAPEKLEALPHCPGGRIPSALSSVAMKALAHRPLDRYDRVGAVSEDVRKFQQGYATSVEQLSTAGQLALLLKRHKGVTIASAVAFLLILILSASFMVKVNAEKAAAIQAGETAEMEAENARAAEEQAKIEAENARTAEKQTAASLALSKIALAEASFRESDSFSMARHLKEVPEDLRNQEWDYLQARSDNSIHTLLPEGSSYNAVAACKGIPGLFAIAEDRTTIDLVDAASGSIFKKIKLQSGAPLISSVDLAPDGSLLAVGQPTGIVLFRLPSGAREAAWEIQGFTVQSIRFSPRGDQLMVVGSNKAKHFVDIYAIPSGKLVAQEKNRPVLNALRWEPGGEGFIGTTQVWTILHRHKKLSDPGEPFPVASGVFAGISITPDGRLFGAAGDGTLYEYDTASREERWRISSGLTPNAIFHTGKDRDAVVLLGANSNGGFVGQVIHTRRKRKIHTFLGLSGSMEAAAFSPETGLLVALDGSAKIWRIPIGLTRMLEEAVQPIGFAFNSRNELWRSPTHPSESRLAAVKPNSLAHPSDFGLEINLSFKGAVDGKRIVATAKREAYLLEHKEDGQLRRVVDRHIQYWRGNLRDFTRDGKILLTGNDKLLQFIDCDKRKQRPVLGRSKTQPLGPMTLGAFVRNTTDFLTVHRKMDTREETHYHLALWNAQGQRLRERKLEVAVLDVDVSPDGGEIALACRDMRIRLLDAETLETRHAFRAHDQAVTSIEYHPTRPLIASGSADLSVKLWNTTNRQLEDSFIDATGDIVGVHFSPDGALLAGETRTRQLLVWETPIDAAPLPWTWPSGETTQRQTPGEAKAPRPERR